MSFLFLLCTQVENKITVLKYIKVLDHIVSQFYSANCTYLNSKLIKFLLYHLPIYVYTHY